jgi:hypothetical protein
MVASRRGKGHFSPCSVRLAKGKGFTHPLHPYDLVSPSGQSANPTRAYRIRWFGHRL